MKSYDDWLCHRLAWAKISPSKEFLEAVQDDAWNSALEVAAMQCDAPISATYDMQQCAGRIRDLKRGRPTLPPAPPGPDPLTFREAGRPPKPPPPPPAREVAANERIAEKHAEPRERP